MSDTGGRDLAASSWTTSLMAVVSSFYMWVWQTSLLVDKIRLPSDNATVGNCPGQLSTSDGVSGALITRPMT
ncbi:hypothetical protein N7453_009995 [Penicillium expansum]|nr:hypothetical protein N7453_009995 [Penicillium expansum]